MTFKRHRSTAKSDRGQPLEASIPYKRGCPAARGGYYLNSVRGSIEPVLSNRSLQTYSRNRPLTILVLSVPFRETSRLRK